jgi:hypothetical protein
MIDTTMTAVPTGLPGTGRADVRACATPAGRLLGYGSALPSGTDVARRRAPEAFTAPFQGTGLPVAVRTERSVAPTVLQPAPIAHTDVPTPNGTTLGIHSPGRPQS